MGTEFVVDGPYVVGTSRNRRGGKLIAPADFWDDDDGLGSERGCYIFAIRNRGIMPAYVGKATKTFKQEIFTPHKLNKYNEALHRWPHGTPVLLFVTTYRRKGVGLAKKISALETFLIKASTLANPDLLNVHHTGPDDWEIKGVTAPHKGAKSEGEKALIRIIKF